MKEKKKRKYLTPVMEFLDMDDGLQPLLAGSNNLIEDPQDYENGGEGFVFTES